MGLKEVLELIVNITQNASKCEENKQKLNDHFTFEPYALFSRIDRDDKKYITRDDLILFLADNNVTIDSNRSTVDLFIEYYDRDFDNKLNFTEFLNFILNKDNNLIRSISTQRETYKLANDEFLERGLEELTTQVILSEFYLFEYANVKKMEIFNQKEPINLLNLFIEMDADKNGFISYEDLEIFLSKRKIKICLEEIQSFVSLFDEDLDGELNWNEFLFMILPSPTNYDYNLEELKIMEGKYHEYYSNRKNEQDKLISSSSTVNNNFASSNTNVQNQNNNTQTYFYSSTNGNNNIPSNCNPPSFSSLSNLLYQIIDFENQIDNMRIKLLSNPNFNLNALFNYFDKYNNQYISFMDFSDALESFDIVSKNSILLFSKYDVNNSGRLTQQNFNNIFLQTNKELPNNSYNLGNEFTNVNQIELVTKTTIVQLFNSLINYMTFLSTLPKWYEKQKDEVSYCFNTIDKNKKGFVTEEEFNLIFDNKLNFEDLLLIMEKIDSDKDGKITYEDMVNLFK